MSATTQAPVLPSIAVHWVKNNVLAAIVFGFTSLVLYGVRHAIDPDEIELGAAVAAYGVAVIVFRAFAGAASGVFTGAVLQRIVPLLPVRTWIALQAALAVTAGVIFEVPRIIPSSGPAPANDFSLGATLLVQFIAGGILGTLTGALEALVLRKVALGVVTWIVCSAGAHAIAFFLAGVMALPEIGSGLSGELAGAALNVLSFAIMSLVTLPALRRLKSRQLSTASQHFT